MADSMVFLKAKAKAAYLVVQKVAKSDWKMDLW